MDNVMPSLKTLLQLPYGWQSFRQNTGPDGLTIHLQAPRKTANCPECMRRSSFVHSRRRRRIQHLPCAGQTLWLIFAIRHWYCRITGLSRVTVSRWVQSGTFPEMSTRPPKRGLLDPWREWLKDGNYNASGKWWPRGLQAVKPSSGMPLPDGVKAGSSRLLPPPDFLKRPE